MTTAETSQSVRLGELDAFRGAAAAWVLLFHYFYQYDHLYGKSTNVLFGIFNFPDGIYGVYLFFMISGFVILMTLRRTDGWLDFVVYRFSRLYPAYWAGILLTATVAWFSPLPGQSLPVSQIVANLTMVHGYFFLPSVDGVYWTLNIELGFYLIMLGLSLSGLLRRVEAIAWIWLGAVLASRLMPLTGFDVPYRIALLLVLDYAQLFVAGMVFYLVWIERYTANRIALLAVCLIVEGFNHGIAATVVVGGFFGLFHLCATGRLARLAHGPLLWLGMISYPLYLTHQMIGYRAIATMLDFGIPAPLAVSAAIAGALLLATALSLAIERPAMRLIRSSYRRRRLARRLVQQPAVTALPPLSRPAVNPVEAAPPVA